MSPFALIESRINQATMRHLSNAIASTGGAPFPVIFDENYVEVLDVNTTGPAFTCAPADLVAPNGSPVSVERTPGAVTVGPLAERFVIVRSEAVDGLALVRLRGASHG